MNNVYCVFFMNQQYHEELYRLYESEDEASDFVNEISKSDSNYRYEKWSIIKRNTIASND